MDLHLSNQNSDSVFDESERFVDLVGHSLQMRELFAMLKKVSPTELTVLIEGETGTGKERVARAIHQFSDRSAMPYVVLDCSAIPSELMESVVFGHEKGAFTGAIESRKGLFELADGGTILLDEVGDLALSLQPKLLRLLESREVKPIGKDRTINVNVRVLAATNRDLRAMVKQGLFREDLYFRLGVIRVSIPPLRDRLDDIDLLAQELLASTAVNERFTEPAHLSPEALEVLLEHHWPGNVRELKNRLERAVSLAEGPLLLPRDVVGSAPFDSSSAEQRAVFTFDPKAEYKLAKQKVLIEFERLYLEILMGRTAGNISEAARQSRLTRYHLRELLKRHEIADKYRQ